MKNYYFLLVLVLVGLKSNGQGSDNPILPRIYEDGYTIEQIRNFALGSTELSKNYRKKLLSVINEGLRRSGEYVNLNEGKPLDERHIYWIYEHVVRNPNDSLPIGYSNTHKEGDRVVDHKSKKPYYGPLDEFIYRTCVLNLDKPSCANINGDMDIFAQASPEEKYEPKPEIVPVEKPKPNVVPEIIPENDWVPPGTIKDAAKMDIPDENQPAEDLIPQQVRNKTYLGRNWPWMAAIGASLITGYFIADHNDWWRAHPIIVPGGQGVDPPPVGGDGK